MNFEDVKHNPNLMISFLNLFMFDNPDERINLIYDKNYSQFFSEVKKSVVSGKISEKNYKKSLKIKNSLARVYSAKEGFASGEPSNIYIHENILLLKNYDEFKSIIKNHEFVHGIDMCDGINIGDLVLNKEDILKMSDSSYHSMMELRAYSNQLLNLKNKIVDPLMIREIKEGYKLHKNILYNHLFNGSKGLEQDIIAATLTDIQLKMGSQY